MASSSLLRRRVSGLMQTMARTSGRCNASDKPNVAPMLWPTTTQSSTLSLSSSKARSASPCQSSQLVRTRSSTTVP